MTTEDDLRCGGCEQGLITMPTTAEMMTQSEQGKQFIQDILTLGGDVEGTVMTLCPSCGSTGYISPPISVEATIMEEP